MSCPQPSGIHAIDSATGNTPPLISPTFHTIISIGMASAFPGPVLAVSPDVVRHLEGEEALPILWTRQSCFFFLPCQSFLPSLTPEHIVFTKCKESLKDGHRLENISWRLWHKSMAETALTACEPSVTEALAADDVLLSEKAYCPPTPEEIPQPPPITFDTMSNVPLSAQGKSHTFKGISDVA